MAFCFLSEVKIILKNPKISQKIFNFRIFLLCKDQFQLSQRYSEVNKHCKILVAKVIKCQSWKLVTPGEKSERRPERPACEELQVGVKQIQPMAMEEFCDIFVGG